MLYWWCTCGVLYRCSCRAAAVLVMHDDVICKTDRSELYLRFKAYINNEIATRGDRYIAPPP